MPNLIPEKRLDRNGRLVTKHVRNGAKTGSASGSLPAPALGQRTVVYPDNSHKDPVRIVLHHDNLRPDRELAALFGGMNGASMNLRGTSPELYDVLSVLAPGDAAFLLSKGKDSAEEVREFLAANNLERLLVDNSSVIQEAVKRRIPATSYLRICDETANRLPQETLLDVAEAHGMKGLSNYDYYQDIKRDYTTLKDIKALGISTITKHPQPNDIREYLWDIHRGESPYSLKELKSLIQKSTKDEMSIAMSMSLADRFGMDFTLGLHDLTESLDMMNYLDRISHTPDLIKPIVKHFDAMAHHRKATSGLEEWTNFEYTDCLDFYAAGIDPETAWDAVSQGITLEQVLAIKEEGIAPSVSGGWL